MMTRTLIVSFSLWLWVSQVSFGQVTQWNVEPIVSIPWDDNVGVPYTQVPGANFGAVAFAMVGNDKVALLCNGTNEIRVFSTSDGAMSHKFTVGYAPRDLVFDSSNYFVLFDQHVTVYSEDGTETENIVPDDIHQQGATRVTVVEGTVHIWLPSGRSLAIQKDGRTFNKEQSGWVMPDGSSIQTSIEGGEAECIWYRDGTETSKRFALARKVAGVFPVGIVQNSVILDVQTFISEGPVAIERHYVAIEMGEGGVVKLKAPDTYYVYADRDIFQDRDGRLLNMVTAFDGVHLFRIVPCSHAPCKDYPQNLKELNYHFNYHLIKVD